MACVQRRLAADRRRRPPRPARRRRRARASANAARKFAPAARAARPRRPLPEPLRRLGLRPRPIRQPGLLDRLRARPQPAARTRRSGRIRRSAARRHAASACRPGADRRCQPRRSGRRTGMSAAVRLGLRANAGQFALLVGLNALVGAMVGLERRGLALGLNEAAGYLGVAASAFVTGALAASYAPRTVVWVGAALIAAAGLLLSLIAVRDTERHVALEQRAHAGDRPPSATLRDALVRASLRDPVLRACSQAGLVNNLNDALAWGLAPLYLAAHGASVREIAGVAAAYPVVWGGGQLASGWLSDHTGRKPLIAAGMIVQAAALGLLVGGDGGFKTSLVAAVLLGAGTAMVYPTLLAAVSDGSQPRERARIVGVYRFWRDFGLDRKSV